MRLENSEPQEASSDDESFDFSTSSQPYLINMSLNHIPGVSEIDNDDCLVSYISEGCTDVGCSAVDDFDVDNTATNHEMVLEGDRILPRHCKFISLINSQSQIPSVTLEPLRGAIVVVNGTVISSSCVLESGDHVTIGVTLFRFINPLSMRYMEYSLNREVIEITPEDVLKELRKSLLSCRLSSSELPEIRAVKEDNARLLTPSVSPLFPTITADKTQSRLTPEACFVNLESPTLVEETPKPIIHDLLLKKERELQLNHFSLFVCNLEDEKKWLAHLIRDFPGSGSEFNLLPVYGLYFIIRNRQATGDENVLVMKIILSFKNLVLTLDYKVLV